MIRFIRGNVSSIGKEEVIIDCNGVGFRLFVPASVISNLPPAGNEATLFTHMNVREDAMLLYGFLSLDDLELFELLLTVNGIGPKAALGILSAIPSDLLQTAILSSDAKTIAKAPGIGKKTAQKVILELKDKLFLSEKDLLSDAEKSDLPENTTGTFAQITDDATEALVALGYAKAEAYRAVKSVSLTETMTVEELLKQSLKNLG